MAVINNNPPAVQQGESNSVMTMVMLVFILILAILFLYYGLPVIRSSMGGGGAQSPQINIPRSVDVNVNNGGGK